MVKKAYAIFEKKSGKLAKIYGTIVPVFWRKDMALAALKRNLRADELTLKRIDIHYDSSRTND